MDFTFYICMTYNNNKTMVKLFFSFYKRVLPLPSENWSSSVDMWFCHKHGNDDTDYKSLSLIPKLGECFVGTSYLLVRSTHLLVRDSHNGTVTCPSCHIEIGAKFVERKKLNGRFKL